MPEVIFSVDRDLRVPMSEQAVPGHNRWHPDIPDCAVSLGIPLSIFDRDILRH